jgi:hypothetical protein
MTLNECFIDWLSEYVSALHRCIDVMDGYVPVIDE